jgi:non-ribosomal peptide synthetase component E (peptide arylation enzyme)
MHALLTNRRLDALHQLANFKTPRRFVFVDDMPRSHPVNRVAKAQLREMLASEADGCRK